jgi:hypothetical protein
VVTSVWPEVDGRRRNRLETPVAVADVGDKFVADAAHRFDFWALDERGLYYGAPGGVGLTRDGRRRRRDGGEARGGVCFLTVKMG